MSEIDFQNGFVVGMALGGKNGAVGGVTPNPNALRNAIITATLVPMPPNTIGLGQLLLITPTKTTLTALTI